MRKHIAQVSPVFTDGNIIALGLLKLSWLLVLLGKKSRLVTRFQLVAHACDFPARPAKRLYAYHGTVQSSSRMWSGGEKNAVFLVWGIRATTRKLWTLFQWNLLSFCDIKYNHISALPMARYTDSSASCIRTEAITVQGAGLFVESVTPGTVLWDCDVCDSMR